MLCLTRRLHESVLIFLPDGRLFGALCALDSRAMLFDDPNLPETLSLFARLIGCFHERPSWREQALDPLLRGLDTRRAPTVHRTRRRARGEAGGPGPRLSP